MKLRVPSLIGSSAWAIYFVVLFGTVFAVAVVSSWHLLAGFFSFGLAAVILAFVSKLVMSSVGYIDTEFVVGLLVGVALVVAAASIAGKLHRPHVVQTKVSYIHRTPVRTPNQSFKADGFAAA
jgi:hypothetical protein